MSLGGIATMKANSNPLYTFTQVQSLDHLKTLYPGAEIVVYESYGDRQGDAWCHWITLRLCKGTFLTYLEEYNALDVGKVETRDGFVRQMELQWVNESKKMYRVVASWDSRAGFQKHDGSVHGHVTDIGIGSNCAWKRVCSDIDKPEAIPTEVVHSLDIVGRRWELEHYGGLGYRQEALHKIVA